MIEFGRMDCNLFRAIRLGYFRSMVRYCNTWGWKCFWMDTFSWVVRREVGRE